MAPGTFVDSDTTITDANVNGGNPIRMNATKLKESIEVFSQAPAVARSDLSTAFEDRLVTGRYAGFGTPKLTLSGKFYASETDPNTIQLAYLHELAASNSVKTLSDAVYGTMKVLITNVSIERTNNSSNGVVNYTLEMIRVSA